MQLIKDLILMYIICWKYNVSLIPYFTKRTVGYVYSYDYQNGKFGGKVGVSIFHKNRMEIFFHEIGHHFHFQSHFHYLNIIRERECGEILSDMTFGVFGKTVERTLYEEAFASAFSRRALTKLGRKCDTGYLQNAFNTYSGSVFKAITKLSAHDHFTTLVDILVAGKNRIDGITKRR